MKKLLSIILSISVILSLLPCLPAHALEEFPKIFNADNIINKGYFKTVIYNGDKVISFKEKDGNDEYITPIFINSEDILGNTEPTLSVEFTAGTAGYYHVWIEFAPLNVGSGNSMWIKFNDEDYQQKKFDFDTDDLGKFQWVKLHSLKATDTGTQTLSILARKRNLYIKTIEITDDPFYRTTYSTQYYPEPVIKPGSNTHPRVLITKGNIQNIKNNLLSDENKAFYDLHSNSLLYLYENIPDTYDLNLIKYIKSNAFMYVINGYEEKGQKAVDTLIDYLEKVSSFSNYYESGNLIYASALTYDWCYELISDDDKDKIINYVINIASAYTEMGWPPVNQSGWGGHGSENTILRDLLAFGIATYDEEPRIFNIVAGRIEDEYKDIRELYYDAKKSPFGSDYGVYRTNNDIYAMLLYRGLEVNNIWDNDKIHYYPYWHLYALRPDNYYLIDGDSRENWEYNDKKNNPVSFSALMISSIYNDGYMKTLYKKEKTRLTDEYLEGLIFNDVTLKESDISELDYSKYFAYPSGSYIARTGWDDDSVIVNMKINELTIDDHNHLDAGGFQIYYKGALATDSGYYQSIKSGQDNSSYFGEPHHAAYTKQTIAHNCILVYDPEEPLDNFGFSGNVRVNSGGQKTVSSSEYPDTAEKMREDPTFNTSKVLAHEHNENIKNPDYTYLKGDLSDAYSDKVSEYERSFMFLNLHNKNVPAVLIVFDHVVSSDENFQKTYLLHGVNAPQIENTRTILTRTEKIDGFSYNGKLINDTLLPKNPVIMQVGQAQNEFLITGTEADENGNPQKISNKNFSSEPRENEKDRKRISEGGGIRTEIKPKEANTEDYFLNVMQVTEADNTETLEAELIESKTHTGVKIADRVVMLGKTKERVADDNSFSFEGEGVYKISVSDLNTGKWYVYNNKNYIGEYDASEDGSTIYFEGEEGYYEILSEKKKYNLTVNCGENGSTSLNSGIYYDNKITFSVTPAYGYKVGNVYLDGIDVTPFGKEEFSLYIGENSTIDITFTKDNENIYMYSPYTFYSHLNSYNGKNAFIAFSKLEGISKDNKIIDYGMLLSDTKENMNLDNKNVKKATVSETFGKELSDGTFAFGIIFYGSGLKNFTNYHIRPYVIYEKNGEEIINYGEIRTKYITNYHPYNDYVITNCEVE